MGHRDYRFNASSWWKVPHKLFGIHVCRSKRRCLWRPVSRIYSCYSRFILRHSRNRIRIKFWTIYADLELWIPNISFVVANSHRFSLRNCEYDDDAFKLLYIPTILLLNSLRLCGSIMVVFFQWHRLVNPFNDSCVFHDFIRNIFP